MAGGEPQHPLQFRHAYSPRARDVSPRLNLIPSHTIIDASLKARLNRHLTLSLNAVNLANKVYLVSRHPSGLRPGHPFGIYGGVRINL